MFLALIFVTLCGVAIINIYEVGLLRRVRMKVDDLITQVNTATNAAADRFKKFVESIQSDATLTAAQETEAATIIATLNAIGADPLNPVPPAPPATPGL